MDEKELYEKAKQILCEITGMEEDEIDIESSLIEDLGIESFDLADLNFNITEQFGIESEYDFFSVEGIVGNPEYIGEDNTLTTAGLEEMKRRLPSLEIRDEDFERGVPLTELLNSITVKDMVEFVKRHTK